MSHNHEVFDRFEGLTFDDVVLIPHLGSATIETRDAMAVLAASNAVAISNGKSPLTPVG